MRETEKILHKEQHRAARSRAKQSAAAARKTHFTQHRSSDSDERVRARGGWIARTERDSEGEAGDSRDDARSNESDKSSSRDVDPAREGRARLAARRQKISAKG